MHVFKNKKKQPKSVYCWFDVSQYHFVIHYQHTVLQKYIHCCIFLKLHFQLFLYSGHLWNRLLYNHSTTWGRCCAAFPGRWTCFVIFFKRPVLNSETNKKKEKKSATTLGSEIYRNKDLKFAAATEKLYIFLIFHLFSQKSVLSWFRYGADSTMGLSEWRHVL